MNLDINSLYFSLLIPFVLEKNELAEELDIKEDVFINTEDVWSLFTSKVEDIDIHLKEKIDIIIQKYNSDVKSSFLESAESILKNTIAKNIFIIKRIKDKLRKAVVRAQNKEKTIHLITTLVVIYLGHSSLYLGHSSLYHGHSSPISDTRHHTLDTRHHTLDTRHLSWTFVTYLGHSSPILDIFYYMHNYFYNRK